MKYLDIKIPPDYGQEVTQMFSQRNNPYCELLFEFIITKIKQKNKLKLRFPVMWLFFFSLTL